MADSEENQTSREEPRREESDLVAAFNNAITHIEQARSGVYALRHRLTKEDIKLLDDYYNGILEVHEHIKERPPAQQPPAHLIPPYTP